MTPRPIVRTAATAALALTALAALAPGASAHGGEAVLELGTDGAGGITAHLTWTEDGHPVEEPATVSVTARSDGGDVVGPLTLALAPEGVGWYAGDSGTLPTGHWTLEATASGPAEAATTTQVDVVPPAEPPAAAATPDHGAAADDDAETPGDPAAETAAATAADPAVGPARPAGATTDAAPADDVPPLTLPLAGAALLLAAGGATAAVRARRRRRT